jgi:ABC-type cobalamin transport system permease subunit
MTEQLKANWFWPIAFALSAIVWLLTNTLPPQDLGYWELAVLFDVLVTLPLLFALCYRRTLTHKNLLIRIIALQCLGIWLATKLVPFESQIFLPQLSWLRYAGLSVLILIEVRIMIALFKILFKSNTDSKQLEDIGMPPLLAKLALLEVRFWRWVFSIFTR